MSDELNQARALLLRTGKLRASVSRWKPRPASIPV